MVWNINALGDKLGEDDIQEIIKKNDINVFLESMKDKDFDIDIPGFLCKNFPRKTNRNKKISGGIVVLLSEKLGKLINFTCNNDCIVWATITNPDNNCLIHMGFIYIPPTNSSYSSKDVFGELENEISIKKATGRVLLAGDFNSRMPANFKDYVMNLDDYNYEPITTSRKNEDPNINSYGIRLLEMCRNTGIQIVNGREPHSSLTSCRTCYKWNGASTVDWLLSEPSFFNHIAKFSIMEKRIDSDHRALYFEIKTNVVEKQIIHSEIRHSKYKWDSNKVENYVDNLKSNECNKLYDIFMNSLLNNEKHDQNVTEKFNEYVTKAIEKNLQKRHITLKRNFRQIPGLMTNAKR